MTTAPTAAAPHWEPLWSQGRRYRQLDDTENRLLESRLGPGRGRPALDIGSGDGLLARRLAELGYRTTGIDCSPTAIALATAQDPGRGRVPAWQCLDFTTDALSTLPEPAYPVITCRLVYRWIDDAAAHLRQADPYDVIYSVCSVPYLDPDRLLPILATSLKPGGRLLFSALHTNSAGTGPSAAVSSRPEILRLPGTTDDHPVDMWVLTPQLWEDLLVQHGLTMEAVTTIDSPKPDSHVSYRLYSARRPHRVPSRPRTSAPPPPHAAVGVGVIVQGPDGILLGRHQRGTWELAGGGVEPGETFGEAAVRELREEAGLAAEPEDAQVLGTLLDRVGDVVRITVPVVVTRWSGVPQQREDAIGAWRFWPLDSLPAPLFVPSAQCLTAWMADLPLDHAPADFQRYETPVRA
ncbi:bifunctional class I SAM-dependent methyltransferase/NUDIX hydrolase [Streptomyces sp. NPDC051183]|uniref:bifunctional class I SAM-dependent methyltransferase/NUDIX hydrolase n=1 Tax=Streptomyces sp. NPDC051183 TaxID=3155165 RepID=UPI00341BD175